MKRVLVTGAKGFVGRHVLPTLYAKGFEVHALRMKDEDAEGENVIWHICDLSNKDEVDNVMQDVKPSHLLHLAWYTAPGLYWKSVENITWVQNSLGLFRSFADCGGKRCVTAGSCAEYDFSSGPLSEDTTPIDPKTLYGICKDNLHRLLKGFAKEAGLSYAWGRIFFLYGPYEKDARLMPYVIKSLLENHVAHCSSGEQIRDYLFVQDVADAFAQLVDSLVSGVFNIGSGQNILLKEIILKIGTKLNKRELIELGAPAASGSEPHMILADNSKIRTQIGWQPKVSLDEGLDRAIAWHKRYYHI